MMPPTKNTAVHCPCCGHESGQKQNLRVLLSSVPCYRCPLCSSLMTAVVVMICEEQTRGDVPARLPELSALTQAERTQVVEQAFRYERPEPRERAYLVLPSLRWRERIALWWQDVRTWLQGR